MLEDAEMSSGTQRPLVNTGGRGTASDKTEPSIFVC